jgi:hypothetical protein
MGGSSGRWPPVTTGFDHRVQDGELDSDARRVEERAADGAAAATDGTVPAPMRLSQGKGARPARAAISAEAAEIGLGEQHRPDHSCDLGSRGEDRKRARAPPRSRWNPVPPQPRPRELARRSRFPHANRVSSPVRARWNREELAVRPSTAAAGAACGDLIGLIPAIMRVTVPLFRGARHVNRVPLTVSLPVELGDFTARPVESRACLAAL